jgi:tRNA(Ile)-lysidine synthase
VARRLRYDAMAEHARQTEADAVAVGHHRDDQAETLLLNLLRGSGPEGLAAMPPSRPLDKGLGIPLIRPLLDLSRDAIKLFAEAEGLPWREDPTNRDPAYDRAFLRTEVFPLLQEKYDRPTEALARAAGLMREYVDATLTPALEDRWSRAYTADEEGGGTLSIDVLRDEPPVWRRRLILEALSEALPDAPQTAAVAAEVDGLLDAQVGKHVELGGGTVWRERGLLRFVPDAAAPDPLWPPHPVPWGEDVPLDRGVLRIDPLDAPPASLDAGTPTVEYVDADRLVDPLAVGTWQTGDRFRPLGLDGTKSVADFLTDEQVPPHRRRGVYVLHTDRHPAWVVGYRLDHRMRVRPSTTQVAKLTWRPRENASDDCVSP